MKFSRRLCCIFLMLFIGGCSTPQPKFSPALGQMLMSANMADKGGNFAMAIEQWKRAIELATKEQGAESKMVLAGKAGLVKTYLKAGQYKEAKSVAEGNQVLEAALPKWKDQFYTNEGESDYDRELRQLQPFLAKANSPNTNMFNVKAKEQVGQFYYRHKEYQTADQYLSQAFDFSSDFFIASANANNGFAEVVTALSAIGSISKGQDNSKNLAFSLGLVKHKLGRLDELSSVYQKAHRMICEISTKVDPKAHDIPAEGVFSNCMRLLFHYANLFAANGMHEKAKKLYLDALRLQKKTTTFRLLAFSLEESADRDYLQWVKGLSNAAFHHMEQSNIYSSKEVLEVYSQAADLKGQLLDIDSAILGQARSATDPVVRQKYDAYVEASNAYESAVLAKKQLDLDVYKQIMMDRATARAELKRAFAFNNPQIYEASRSLDILGSLPEETLFIDLFKIDLLSYETLAFEEAAYYAVLASKGADISIVKLGGAEKVDVSIERYHKIVSSALSNGIEPDKSELDDVLEEIYAASLAQVDKHLNGKEVLLVNNDGAFNAMPLSVLRRNGQYMIETFNVNYVQTLNVIENQDVKSPDSYIVLANPDYEASPDTVNGYALRGIKSAASDVKAFNSLPETQLEAEAIAKRMRGIASVHVLTGSTANKFQLRQTIANVRGRKVLHIASHGFFLSADDSIPPSVYVDQNNRTLSTSYVKQENPMMRSGLALAGANSKDLKVKIDGMLTASEFSTMNMDDVYLAVLSACNTGSGDIQSGEGVFGLQRGLLMAGVENLVLSAWAIPSNETVELMDSFYQEVAEGLPVGEALRKAQLKLIAKNNNPFFWGAFSNVSNGVSL